MRIRSIFSFSPLGRLTKFWCSETHRGGGTYATSPAHQCIILLKPINIWVFKKPLRRTRRALKYHSKEKSKHKHPDRAVERPLTSDVETQFILDFAVLVPDGVAALVRTRDDTEGHMTFADADPALVAAPGQPRGGKQYQSRPGGEGKGGRLTPGGDVQPTGEGLPRLYLNVWLASTAMGLYSRVTGEFTSGSRMRKSPPYLMICSLVQSGKQKAGR